MMARYPTLLYLFAALCWVTLVKSDVFLHSPRGSNNRLNENTAQRQNADRLFDSQNNNKGGYNVGDSGNAASGNNAALQYQMKYFQSGLSGTSHLSIEWTNQHACGGNSDADQVHCQIVLQYMCQDEGNARLQNIFRNGVNTNTPKYTAPNHAAEEIGEFNNRYKSNVDVNRGQHESFYWYDSCYTRERNQGLFTSDQQLGNNNLGYSSAIFTRQNNNGNRRGYECPEERDYYPYFHSSPWKDIAVLTEDASTMCPYFQSESFNVKSKYECIELFLSGSRKPSRWNNQQQCTSNGGKWTELFNYLEIDESKDESSCGSASKNGLVYKWALPYSTSDGATKQCLVMLNTPECMEAPWSRTNHLGNGQQGMPLNYTWNLPYFPSGNTQQCLFRIRYNISTDDYNPYTTDSSSNNDNSPVQQNPTVNIGLNFDLQMALNTNQYGRTFQDRSHIFQLRARPNGTDDAHIYNLNVRGKRGNIVQTFPAVEYDFIPAQLEVQEGALVHVQWTGSNTHNNVDDGDAGEGTGGTDRHNIVEISGEGLNYPVSYAESTMWKNAQLVWIYHGNTNFAAEDLAASMSSSGYYQCMKSSDCGNQSTESKGKVNNQLNNAPASYEGALIKFKKGKYAYMCTRNNNFTNRSQKGKIIVK